MIDFTNQATHCIQLSKPKSFMYCYKETVTSLLEFRVNPTLSSDSFSTVMSLIVQAKSGRYDKDSKKELA